MSNSAEEKTDGQKAIEETVFLHQSGAGSGPEAAVSIGETVALPRDGDGKPVAFDPAPVDQTIDLPKEDSKGGDEQSSVEDTLVLTRKGEKRRKSRGMDTASLQDHFVATDLEMEFFEKSVKRNHSGKFRFEEKLIAGGMGAIFKVLDRELERISAMKTILPSFKNESDTLKSFIAEAKITGMLEHPNIIPVHEIGFLKNAGLYFTMKLANAEALNDVLDKLRMGDPEYVEKYNTFARLGIFRKVCDALSFAHSKNIIHQDIKPHNIMVGDYGEVLLMDWGLANYIGDPDDETDPVVRENMKHILQASAAEEDQIRGSPTYMSPEQTTGNPELLDKRTDIFLLGSTLYHMFTLEPPFMGKDIYEVLFKAETGDCLTPEKKDPELPEEICRIIKKTMAHEKEDRYQTVDDLSRDIDDLIAGKWTRQEKKIFPRGGLLMKEGETGEEAYLIMKGKVQVIKERGGNKIVLGTLGEGDIVGEMALISKEPRSASVEALEKTEVSILTKNLLSQHLKKLPPFMEKIVSAITERLQTANTLINPHSTRDSTYFVLEQLRLIFKDKSDEQPAGFSIPFPNIAREISENLGIPKQQVKKILLRAAKQGYVVVRKNAVTIPDIAELAQYTKFGKLISKLPPEKQEIVFDTIKKKGRTTDSVS